MYFVGCDLEVIGQSRAHLGDGPRQRRRRQGALQLQPGFLRGKASFQRFALRGAELIGELLQGLFALIERLVVTFQFALPTPADPLT